MENTPFLTLWFRVSPKINFCESGHRVSESGAVSEQTRLDDSLTEKYHGTNFLSHFLAPIIP